MRPQQMAPAEELSGADRPHPRACPRASPSDRFASRRGVALAVTVVALFAAAFLVAGVFFLAFTERRMGRGAVEMVEALANAEGAVQRRLATWERGILNTMPVGRTVVDSSGGSAGHPRASTEVRRLGGRVFLITAVAAGRGGRARRRAGLLVRLVLPELPGLPPLPAPELGAEAGGPRSGLDLSAPRSIGEAPCDEPRGASAPVEKAAWDGDRPDLWTAILSQWEAIADKPLPPGRYVGLRPSSLDGACLAPDPRNWGAPLDRRSPCAEYLPVIHAPGDLELAGGEGQGVLVVVGDLTVRSGFSFYGVVIVSGRLVAQGVGGRLQGRIWVRDLDRRSAERITVVHSPCAADRAVLAAAFPAPLRERAWIGARR
jgi:hypothetical protein